MCSAFLCINGFAQSTIQQYEKLAEQADNFFFKKEYKKAVGLYQTAIKVNNDQARVKHRYRLAAAWTALSMPDSAFIQLYRIVEKGNFSEISLLEKDLDFLSLHEDKRWKTLLERMRTKD
jgi:hypothetical protein